MHIELHRLAKEDLLAGYHLYERQAADLGIYFLDSLYTDLDSLGIYASIHRKVCGYHRLLAKTFPYAIYYRMERDRVLVFRSSRNGTVSTSQQTESTLRMPSARADHCEAPQNRSNPRLRCTFQIALADHRCHLMADLSPLTGIIDELGHLLRQSQAPVRFPQQHQPAVRTDIAAVKLSYDPAAIAVMGSWRAAKGGHQSTHSNILSFSIGKYLWQFNAMSMNINNL